MINNGFVDALRTAVLTMDDDEVMACLRIVSDERAARKKQLHLNVKSSLKIGDRVWFTCSRRGRVEGNVKKVKIKKAIIETNTGDWDVPFHMLKHC